MAVTSLLERTPLRAEQLATAAQCSVEEAQDTLVRVEQAHAVERLANRAKAFRLSADARARFSSRLQYPTRRRLEEHLDMIRPFLDGNVEISRDDAAALLDVVPGTATRILSALAREGSLVTVANTRGPRVRYRLPAAP